MIWRYGDPVYSQVELDLANEYIREYLTKKIQKISNAQTKTGTLAPQSQVAEMLPKAVEDFIAFSEMLVSHWYQAYQESEEAPNSDVFVVLYEEDAKEQVASVFSEI